VVWTGEKQPTLAAAEMRMDPGHSHLIPLSTTMGKNKKSLTTETVEMDGKVRSPWLVDNAILEAHKLCIHLELPRSMKPLISDMHQAPLICKYCEFCMLQI
jgi:hypothetical protein